MKLNRNVSIVLVILFIIITSYTAVEVISLPKAILSSIEITENTKIEVAETVAESVFIWLGIDLLLVLLIIFSLSTANASSKADNIVYVEQDASKKATQQEETEEDKQYKLEQRIQAAKGHLEAISKDNSEALLKKKLNYLCEELKASVGAVYKTMLQQNGMRNLKLIEGYAFYLPDSKDIIYEFGEGLAGQVAKSARTTIFDNIPEGYIKVTSGLGNASPSNLIVLPVRDEGETVKGVLEIASFTAFSEFDKKFIQALEQDFLLHLN